MKRFVAAALLLALHPFIASAQIKVGAAAESSAIPAIGPAGINSAEITLPQSGVSLLSGSISLSVAPAPTPVGVTNVAIAVTPAVLAAQAIAVSPMPSVAKPVALKLIAPKSATAVTQPLTRSEKAAVLVSDQVADWGADRRPEETLAPIFSAQPSALTPFRSAAAANDRPEDVPTPKTPAPRGSPRVAAGLVAVGSTLLAAAVAAVFAPALVPAAVVSALAPLTFGGLALLAVSRFFRTPGTMPDAPPAPPAKDGGYYLGTFKALWAAAKNTADIQKVLADRVGGHSWSAFRDWLLGGMRTGLYWLGVALMTMLAGAAAVKIPMMFTAKAAVAAATPPAALAMIPLWTFISTFAAPALAQEVGVLAVFFGLRALANKLGAGKAAPWIAGIAALAVSAVPLLALTHAAMVVSATLALEAGVLWTAARTNSWVSALSLKGILGFFSIESARLVAALAATGTAALVGLPAVWGGVLVGVMALLAWRLKSPGLNLKAIGEWWRTPEPGGRPKSPWRILSSGLVWGLAVYAIGDLSYWAVNWFLPGSEPAPGILAKMLTTSVDLVLFNFVIVGLVEEYVFRRGLYKSILNKLEKWNITGNKGFWLAAISSGLIFSGFHYVDWGAMLAHIGIGTPSSAAAVAGAYAFTWAGFVSRAVLGVVLAGLYRWSGILLVPIAAHFWADTMEGLGLRWGFPAFLALAAAALVLSFLFKAKPKQS